MWNGIRKKNNLKWEQEGTSADGVKMTPRTQENFLIEDLSQLFQNRPTKNEHISPWPVGFSRVARIGDLKNLWHAHVLVSTKPISCKFKSWTIVSRKLDIPWAINQRVMLFVHITTRNRSWANTMAKAGKPSLWNVTWRYYLNLNVIPSFSRRTIWPIEVH